MVPAAALFKASQKIRSPARMPSSSVVPPSNSSTARTGCGEAMMSRDWGAARAGEYTFLYGRVYPGDSAASIPPVLVYLIDSLGFRAVFRPKVISYEDGRTIRSGSTTLRVPSRAMMYDVRGGDTLRIDLSIEDAIATDTRPQTTAEEGERGDPLGTEKAHPYFIQMKGTARISGRLEGRPLTGTGTGFFETYR